VLPVVVVIVKEETLLWTRRGGERRVNTNTCDVTRART